MTTDDTTNGPDDDALGERVAHYLNGKAAEVSPLEAWDDLASRAGRGARRRERALAGALLIALLGGPVVGYVAGRSDDGDAVATGVRAGGTDDTTADTDPEATVERVEPSDAAEVFRGTGSQAHGGVGMMVDGIAGPLDLVFLRTTEGIDIRAYREEYPQQGLVIDDSSGWTPPEGCYPTYGVVVELSSEAVVGEAYGSVYGSPEGGIGVSFGVVGVRESAPVWTVVVEAPGAAVVRARFADGATDEMEPVDGIAVLAHAAPVPDEIDENTWQELYEAGATVEALDSGGAVVASTGTNVEAPYRDECEPPPPPPPTLPEPGAEQPADVDAARAAVVQAFDDAFTGTNDEATRMAAIERGEELSGLMEELAGGTFAQQVTDARAEVRDMVFTSATEAAVLFDIVIEDYSDFPNYVGGAVLVDGAWKVSHETVCQAVGLAAASCPG